MNLKRRERLEEAVRLQKEEKRRRLSAAREISANEEAEDSKVIRRRRALLVEAEEPVGVTDEEVLPPEEIKPSLTEEEAPVYNKQDGTKGYSTDVIVESVEFAESKKKDDFSDGTLPF